MNGTTLTQTQFALLSASILQCLPEGIMLDVSDSWRENHEKLRVRLAFLAEMAPEPKRKKKTFDEVAYYQTPGILVYGDLEGLVGLQNRPTRGAAALKKPRLLATGEREDTMFGAIGSAEHTQKLANAVDLGQIAGKIEAQ